MKPRIGVVLSGCGVYDGAEIYRGPYRSHGPDLVVGYNVGCGIKLDVGYAQTRRQTLGWAHGLCWFEYTDKLTIVRLETLSPHYRLPL